MSALAVIPIKRALISVSDKTGLVEFGRALVEQDVEILSTGGSARVLKEAAVPVIEVSEFTGFPEIMDGRVKTLHPKIHGGLLAIRGKTDHDIAMESHDIQPIDLLVVNLYPFESTLESEADFATCIENIDIGGPSLIRAAAKNHAFVTVVVDPCDYNLIIKEINANDGSTTDEFRFRLAAKAFAQTGDYDATISNWFSSISGEKYPYRKLFRGRLKQKLRYGENPHQEAAFYVNDQSRPGVATALQHQGKELSYNNLNDTDAAFELVSEFKETPACVIIKHANPCGVAVAENLADAYKRALSCDTESAFGGIIAFNQTLDELAAKEIIQLFAEVVIAPEISHGAMAVFGLKQDLRVLTTRVLPHSNDSDMILRSIGGGYLVQDPDRFVAEDLKVVTKRTPSDKEMADLMFAFTVSKHVKSNAIVYCKDGMTVGIGAGQMSRVNASRIAAWKAKNAAQVAGDSESWANGSVVASDAFFPFADGLLAAAAAGVTAVIQPGGSMRDAEVIAAADQEGLAMVMTGMRHFRH